MYVATPGIVQRPGVVVQAVHAAPMVRAVAAAPMMAAGPVSVATPRAVHAAPMVRAVAAPPMMAAVPVAAATPRAMRHVHFTVQQGPAVAQQQVRIASAPAAPAPAATAAAPTPAVRARVVADPTPTVAAREVLDGAREILCYGDSNTAGFPPPLKPYGEHLEKLLRQEGYPCNVTSHGNSGATAKDLLAKIDEAAIPDVTNTMHPGLRYLMQQKKWDLVIIMLGTNDMGAMDNADNTFKYVKQLHEVCHSFDVRTVALAAVTIPTIKDAWGLKPKRDGLARMLACYEKEDDEEQEERVLAFEDPKRLVPRNAVNWAADDLHITEQGQAVLAKKVLPIIELALDKITAMEEMEKHD